MNSKLPPGTRYRPRLSTGRRRRLFLRLSDDEYDDVIAAAGRFGLTPTGFCSQAAVDTARNLDRSAEPMQQTLAALQAELFQARVTLNQLRTELSNTRDDRRASPDDLDKIITRAGDAVADLDTAATRIHQRLKPSRSTLATFVDRWLSFMGEQDRLAEHVEAARPHGERVKGLCRATPWRRIAMRGGVWREPDPVVRY